MGAERDAPYLSIVVTADGGAAEDFEKAWSAQAARFGLNAELQRAESREKRNEAIRRAGGEFILVTEAGVRFSAELVEFLATRCLEHGRLYRIDCHEDGRVHAREGTFRLGADGLREGDDPGIHFSDGWFPAEVAESGERFRWAGNDAEVILRMAEEGRVIRLDVEAGPGIGEWPAVLQAIDEGGERVAEWKLDGRIEVELAVPPPRTGELQRFRLRVPEGGCAVRDDPRILNLRVWRCEWVEGERAGRPERSPMGPTIRRMRRPGALWPAIRLLRARGHDVFEAGAEFRLGREWYELEESGGERFRWAGQDAEMLVRANRDGYRLAMLVEAGPSAGAGARVLAIRDSSGRVVARAALDGVTYVKAPLGLGRGMTTALTFALEGGGVPVEGDTRVMDFRVFACGGESAGAGAPGDAYGCWSALTVASHVADRPAGAVAAMGKPPYLHANAGGSFLLMAREHWLDLRGFAELEDAIDVDALACYTVHYAGVREQVLCAPMRIDRPRTGRAPQSIDTRLAELITELRTLRAPFIFNAGAAAVAAAKRPYVSVVITARNDNHGGNLLGRMQAFFDGWLGQADRYGLESEVVVVEWNPPPDRPRLMEALRWDLRTSVCPVRFIEVPAEAHRRWPNADAVPLHQMIAKNAGIRRARGEFVLATNLDIVMSAELMQFLAARRLERRRMYRIDRTDVASGIPEGGGVDALLKFCAAHRLRVFAREGDFAFGARGLRELERDDIAAEADGIRLGAGWYGVEAFGGEHFRWIAEEAEIVLTEPRAGSRLAIDVETGPSAGGREVKIEIVNASGEVVAAESVMGRRGLRVETAGEIATGFRIRAKGANIALARDLRKLNLRVFGLRWDGEDGAQRPGPDWDAFDPTASPFASRMRDAAYLHTNACGDFTLLAREDWFALRGYPEFPIWPMHIDSLLCYAAHHAGNREVILPGPLRLYHIEHLVGAGWTPEGETERRARIRAKGVPVLEYEDFVRWVDRMRRFNAPILFGRESWGLGGEELRETLVQ